MSIPKPVEVKVGAEIVGVYEYGDPGGQPVLVLHGTPACGAGFAWADQAARDRRLRLVAPDRPGVGLSTPAAEAATVANYPARLAALADALGFEQFSVWGYSGGGPYAVACAALLGERVRHVAVASGMGQIGAWAAAADFAKTDRQFLGLATNHPIVARTMLGAVGRLARWFPGSAVKSFVGELSDSDRAVLDQLGTPAEKMTLFTQAFVRGASGVVDDYRAIAGEWGVVVNEGLANTAVPMSIWHGDADTMVPVAHAHALHQRVPNASLTIWPGEGHLAPITNVGHILDAIASS